MKISYLVILTACATAGNVYAEAPRLPPVLDSSVYNEPTPAALPSPASAPISDDSTNLDKLKSDVSELRNKLQEQEDAIYHLKHDNADLQQKVTGKAKKAAASDRLPDLDAKLPAPPKSSAKTAAPATEKEQYQRGTDLLKKGDYAQAIAQYKGFIKAHPTSSYADNAQYWIGVALLNKGDKKSAIKAFDQVARTYPKSEKAPDALFKLGDTLLNLKDRAKAAEYFDYVIQNYPGTEGAKLAAKKKASAKL